MVESNGILTSRAQSVKGRIPSPCSRPIVSGLHPQLTLAQEYLLSVLTRKLLLNVLEKLVAVAVDANQGTGFGIT